MASERAILHCDMNSFYASCEAAYNPKLQGKPIAVCGDPERRNGIVLTASYPAKRMGVKTGMALWEAQQHCRDIIFVPAHYDLYTRYSKYTREIFLRFTDQVEPFGLDEAWLDCTASQSLFGTGEKIAKKISDTVKDELGITCSIGVSWNKVFAKLGSDYKKPDATTIISGTLRTASMTGPCSCMYRGTRNRTRKSLSCIVCFDDEAAFSHYKVLFETFKETCSDNVSYKAVVNTMNQEDYLKENIKEVPVFQSIEKQKLVFLEQAQPEDEVEYEIVADVKKMQELVKPIMPKMPVQANRIVVAAEPMRVFGKRYTEVRRVAAEAVKQLPKLHIDYDAGTMTFNDENIDLNPNLSEVAKNIKSIQKFFSGMDYFYGDVEQAKKDYFKYMTWYLATPFMANLRYFASKNNYDTKLFPMYGVIYGDSNGGKTTFIKFLVKLMCGETVKMNTTEDFTATRIDGLKRVCEGLPLNIDDLAKTQFQNHSERVIKNDEWGISDRLVNYPAVSITSNKITSLTKDLSKRAIICRIGAKIDNERGAKNSKRVNESMSELTTAFYGEYVRRMLVCIDEMTTEMRENANGKEYFPDIFHASSSVIADIFEACGIDLPDYVRILYYNDYMGDESIGRAAIEKIELAWQADPSKFRVDKKQNRLIYSYPPDGPWYELKYIADELPNSLEAEISGGNQLIMNYEQAQELFGIKFRRWLGIFNL